MSFHPLHQASIMLPRYGEVINVALQFDQFSTENTKMVCSVCLMKNKNAFNKAEMGQIGEKFEKNMGRSGKDETV